MMEQQISRYFLHKPDMIPIDYRGFLSTQRYACAAAMAGCQFHRGEGVHKIAHLFLSFKSPVDTWYTNIAMENHHV